MRESFILFLINTLPPIIAWQYVLAVSYLTVTHHRIIYFVVFSNKTQPTKELLIKYSSLKKKIVLKIFCFILTLLPSLWLSLVQPRKSWALASDSQHLCVFLERFQPRNCGEMEKTSLFNLGGTASLVEEMLWWFCSTSFFFFNGGELQGNGGNLKKLVYQSNSKRDWENSWMHFSFLRNPRSQSLPWGLAGGALPESLEMPQGCVPLGRASLPIERGEQEWPERWALDLPVSTVTLLSWFAGCVRPGYCVESATAFLTWLSCQDNPRWRSKIDVWQKRLAVSLEENFIFASSCLFKI